MTDTARPGNGLSRSFKILLQTAVGMLFLSIIGGTLSFYLSNRIGHAIVLCAVVAGNICLLACLLLRLTGRHLDRGKQRP